MGDDEPECTREGGSELFVGQRMREWGTVDEMQESSIEEKCNNLPMTKKQNGWDCGQKRSERERRREVGWRCGAVVVIVVSWWWGALAVGLTSTTPMLHSTHHPMLGTYNRSIGKFNSPVYNAVGMFSSYNYHLHVPTCTLYSVLHTPYLRTAGTDIYI